MCPRENQSKTTTRQIEQTKCMIDAWMLYRSVASCRFWKPAFFRGQNRGKLAVCFFSLGLNFSDLYECVVWLHDDYPVCNRIAFNSDIFVISFFICHDVDCRTHFEMGLAMIDWCDTRRSRTFVYTATNRKKTLRKAKCTKNGPPCIHLSSIILVLSRIHQPRTKQMFRFISTICTRAKNLL